jgi:hypothetical protein
VARANFRCVQGHNTCSTLVCHVFQDPRALLFTPSACVVPKARPPARRCTRCRYAGGARTLVPALPGVLYAPAVLLAPLSALCKRSSARRRRPLGPSRADMLIAPARTQATTLSPVSRVSRIVRPAQLAQGGGRGAMLSMWHRQRRDVATHRRSREAVLALTGDEDHTGQRHSGQQRGVRAPRRPRAARGRRAAVPSSRRFAEKLLPPCKQAKAKAKLA